MSATQQVITVDDISAENAPVIYVAGGLKQFLEHARAQATGEVPDLTTRKGRERIASLAAQVSKSKTAVEKPGRDYLKRLKEMPKVVEAELREFVNSMDALRDATRQPLTEWEKAEDARIDAHNDGIRHIQVLAEELHEITAEDLADRILQVEATAIGGHWQEFEAEAARAKDVALTTLRAALVKRQEYEASQAELARLRREAEERAAQDRIRKAKEEAVELERQRVAQEQQAERDAAAQREQALKDQALAQEQAAERQRLQLELQAEQAKRAAAQASADREAAERRAEQDRINAEARQAEAVERARLDEVARQQAAADEILRQQKAREADQAHKVRIMGAAKEALMGMNISEELAKAIILKIARREVPNVSINF